MFLLAEPNFKLMADSDEFVFDNLQVVESDNPFDNIAKKPNNVKVLTKHSLIDPEPASASKKARIVSQQEFVEDVDNAPELTDALTKKMVHLRAEQAAKIQSNLQEIKNWKAIGLKISTEMREVEATITKLDNMEEVPKIPPHKDPKRLANFSVQSPYEVRATQILGESRVQKHCYGCSNGMGMPTTNSKVNDAFENEVVQLFLNNDWIAAAQQSELTYKNAVIATVDPSDPNGELPEWKARDIFDHFTMHSPDELIRRRWKRMQITEIMRVIYENSIFTCNPEIMTIAHRAPDTRDITIDRDAVELWMKLSAQETKLGEGDPKKYLFKNDRVTIDRVAPAMTRKISTGRQLKLPSLFNPESG
jgi:hypothetical protein